MKIFGVSSSVELIELAAVPIIGGPCGAPSSASLDPPHVRERKEPLVIVTAAPPIGCATAGLVESFDAQAEEIAVPIVSVPFIDVVATGHIAAGMTALGSLSATPMAVAPFSAPSSDVTSS